MKVLLDTHVFLWWITNQLENLSPKAEEVMRDGKNELFLSAASGWEIAIKAQLGKLTLPEDPISFIAQQLHLNAIHPLPIQLNHALHVYALPSHHRDPFDRMLVAQSQVEKLPLLTLDPQIARYQVEVIW